MGLRSRSAALAVTTLLAIGGCAGEVHPGLDTPMPETTGRALDLLLADFTDGKFDAAGVPIGGRVFEGTDCERIRDRLCLAAFDDAARGRYGLNVRFYPSAMTDEDQVTVSAWRGEPTDITSAPDYSATFSASEVRARIAPDGFADLSLDVLLSAATNIHAAVDIASDTASTPAAGFEGTPIQRIEWYRDQPRLILSPGSGVLEDGDANGDADGDAPVLFQAELMGETTVQRPFRFRCNDEDYTEDVYTAVTRGDATLETTPFRTLFSAPLTEVFAGCSAPRHVVVETARDTSEALYLDEPLACPEDDGRPRVLLTGFMPFPAGQRALNISNVAVDGFDARGLDVHVSRLTLPVEYNAAPELAVEFANRCQMDLVIGFGQGRSAIDLETTAYNEMNTGSTYQGVTDNRGKVYLGEAILDDGPREVRSRLPLADIHRSLNHAGVRTQYSSDPGRYVCNNLFYNLVERTEVPAGFIHLPRIFSPTMQDEMRFQTLIETAITTTLRD